MFMAHWFAAAASLDEVHWVSVWFSWTYTVAYLLAIFSIPSVLIQRQGRPQAALAWILALFMLPIVGLFFWWAIGRSHLKRKRRKRRLATGRRTDRLATLRDELPAPPEEDWDFFALRRLPEEEAEWAFTPTKDNRAELLVNAKDVYPAMEEMIRSAKQYIHLQFYIWQADETGARFRDLLVERAAAGVEVRVLFDAVGARTVRGNFMRPLVEAGGDVAAFMPPTFFRRSLDLNFRNHRKLIVADSCGAIVGGLNIGDEYRGKWCDAAVLLHGPVVDQVEETFADDWYFVTNEDFSEAKYYGGWNECMESVDGHPAVCGIVASGPHTRINLTREAFFIAITRAEERVWITSPYFVPDQVILAALRTAVVRGIDVRIIVPEKSDSRMVTWAGRSFFPELLRSGVRIWSHRKGFLHSKCALIDADLSVIGSANMDIRSFKLNFEASCFLKSESFATDLSKLFKNYVDDSVELSLEEVEANSYFSKLVDSLAHLMSPLM